MTKHITHKKLQYLTVLGGLFVLLSLSSAFKNYSKADMRDYYYPQKYFNNISAVATKGSIIMGDLDYFTFPFFYYQFVEHKRTDLISIDINLLKRSWYVKWLENKYPVMAKKSQDEIDKFLAAVAPFESNEPYNGNKIQVCYENMIRSFIDNNLRDGRNVYITYINRESQQILAKYPMEPVYAAFKIIRNEKITNVRYSDFDLDDFIVPPNSTDQILNKFDLYYGDLILSRANMFYKLKDKNDALINYKYAMPFFKNNDDFLNYINRAIDNLKAMN